MSSHHSKRFFNLHHEQENNARQRRRQYQEDRIESFLQCRAVMQMEGRLVQFCIMAMGVLCFVYMNMASVAYLSFIIGA